MFRCPAGCGLSCRCTTDGEGGSRYRQRTLFQPYGLAGEAFWKASAPFRNAVFGGIARDIACERRTARRGHASIDPVSLATTSTNERLRAPVRLDG